MISNHENAVAASVAFSRFRKVGEQVNARVNFLDVCAGGFRLVAGDKIEDRLHVSLGAVKPFNFARHIDF